MKSFIIISQIFSKIKVQTEQLVKTALGPAPNLLTQNVQARSPDQSDSKAKY